MTITAGGETPVETPVEVPARFEPETPFAEAQPETAPVPQPAGFVPWAESLSPFAETSAGGVAANAEQEAFAEEIFETLHDESFDEAVAQLVGETSEAIDHGWWVRVLRVCCPSGSDSVTVTSSRSRSRPNSTSTSLAPGSSAWT